MDRKIKATKKEEKMGNEKKEEKKRECFFCGTPCTEDSYCYGCKEHICDECEEMGCDMPFGDHEVEEHKKEE